MRTENGNCKRWNGSPMCKSELLFINKFSNKEKTYIHHPLKIYFKIPGAYGKAGGGYLPDFYCVEARTYIEISGSRSAFLYNRYKYELVRKKFPCLRFVVVKLYNKTVETVINKRLRVLDFKSLIGISTEVLRPDIFKR